MYTTATFTYTCLNILAIRISKYSIRMVATVLLLSVPRVDNLHTEHCTLSRCSGIWNKLSLYIRQHTYNCFKIMLKRWLLGNQNMYN